jgi:5-formyltetrahydrofolate cyclo-ligase
MQAPHGESRLRIDSKALLRAEILARRNALTARQIADRSSRAGDHLFSAPEFAAAHVVMFFITFGSEIHTLPMIVRALAEGKRIAAPRSERTTRSLIPAEITDPDPDLVPGAHRILEPAPHCLAVEPDLLDVVIVPAAVWAEDGYRVGYGAGYYDRFLSRNPRAARIGLGFEVQVVPCVPRDAHDLPVDLLVTDVGIRTYSHRSRARV